MPGVFERARARQRERRERRASAATGCFTSPVWGVIEIIELIVLILGAAVAGFFAVVVAALGCGSG